MIKRLSLGIMTLIGLLLLTAPALAGTYNITITGMGLTCADFTTDYNQNLIGTTDDGGGVDRFGVVIYDREGTAIAWRPGAIASTGVANTTPQAGITWTHVATAQSRPFTIKTFDTTITVTGVADAEGGTELFSADFDPATFGVCGALPVGPLLPPTPPATGGTTSAPPVPAIQTDSRINPAHGDLTAVVYPATDSTGSPALNVYCVLDGGGVFALQITAETLMDGMSANVCNVAVYQLTDGTLQINITTVEAKRYEIICSDLTCSARTLRAFDPSA